MRNIQQFIFNIYDVFAIEIAFKLLDILFIKFELFVCNMTAMGI